MFTIYHMKQLARWPYILGVVLLSVLAGAGVATTSANLSLVFPVLVFAFVVLGVSIIVHWARKGEALSLLPLITGFYLLAFPLGALYYQHPGEAVGTSALVGFRSSYTTNGLVEALALALAGFAVFATAFVASNFMAICRSLPKPRAVPPRNFALVIWILVIVGWFARILMIKDGLYFRYSGVAGETSQIGQFSTLTVVVANVPLMAFALVSIERGRTGRYGFVYWLMLVVELAWALPSGERARIVGIGLVLLLNRYYGTSQRFPWRQAVVGLFVVVFIVFPFGALYRGQGDSSGYQRAPGAQIQIAAQEMLSDIPAVPNLAFAETFSRFSDIASVATIVTKGRSYYPNSAQETITTWVQGVIPRFILPTKSNPGTTANKFGIAYGIIFHTSQASISPTQVGDFYGSFGFWGMLLGMGFAGMAARGLEEYLHDRRTNPMVLAIFGTMIGRLLLGQETTFAVGFIQSLKDVFVYALIAAIALWLARGRLTATRRSGTSKEASWTQV
jgi:hypothetical protein